MKRDMDLAREILLAIEREPHAEGRLKNLDLPGEPDETAVSYHIMLLAEAGLIEALNLSSSSGFAWRAKRLTWEGHEFLDAARDKGLWERAKALVQEKAGGLGFNILNQTLVELAKRQILG